MSVERCSGRYFMLALSGLVLAACSPNASTAVPPVQVAAPAMAAAAVTTAPLVTGCRTSPRWWSAMVRPW